MLKLRRGRVVSVNGNERVAKLSVELDGESGARDAIAYPALTGPVETGDEVVVNVEARDLGLGSGGFDIVHVNLTRGLSGEGAKDANVMKLNYTPVQHAVDAIEEGMDDLDEGNTLPVAVLALHGQLAPAAFAASHITPGVRVGYLQTAGGALPGQLSDVVHELLRRELICDHITVAPCYGGQHEAITVEGAIQAGARGFAQRSFSTVDGLSRDPGATDIERRPTRSSPRAQPPHGGSPRALDRSGRGSPGERSDDVREGTA